jgi:hypothetical protein
MQIKNLSENHIGKREILTGFNDLTESKLEGGYPKRGS